MEYCKWMTTREMATHSSLLLLWKVFWIRLPVSMTRKIHLDGDHIAITEEPRLLHTTSSWRIRATESWNLLPKEIREQQSLPIFKRETKKWLLALRDPG